MQLGFEVRLIFGVIQAGSPYGFMSNVPKKFRKVTVYKGEEEHVNLHSEKTGNTQVKFYCSFNF